MLYGKPNNRETLSFLVIEMVLWNTYRSAFLLYIPSFGKDNPQFSFLLGRPGLGWVGFSTPYPYLGFLAAPVV